MESIIGHKGTLAWRQWFIFLRAACYLLESVRYSAFPQTVYKQSLVTLFTITSQSVVLHLTTETTRVNICGHRDLNAGSRHTLLGPDWMRILRVSFLFMCLISVILQLFNVIYEFKHNFHGYHL